MEVAARARVSVRGVRAAIIEGGERRGTYGGCYIRSERPRLKLRRYHFSPD